MNLKTFRFYSSYNFVLYLFYLSDLVKQFHGRGSGGVCCILSLKWQQRIWKQMTIYPYLTTQGVHGKFNLPLYIWILLNSPPRYLFFSEMFWSTTRQQREVEGQVQKASISEQQWSVYRESDERRVGKSEEGTWTRGRGGWL